MRYSGACRHLMSARGRCAVNPHAVHCLRRTLSRLASSGGGGSTQQTTMRHLRRLALFINRPRCEEKATLNLRTESAHRACVYARPSTATLTQQRRIAAQRASQRGSSGRSRSDWGRLGRQIVVEMSPEVDGRCLKNERSIPGVREYSSLTALNHQMVD
jgi:hypothetical protein